MQYNFNTFLPKIKHHKPPTAYSSPAGAHERRLFTCKYSAFPRSLRRVLFLRARGLGGKYPTKKTGVKFFGPPSLMDWPHAAAAYLRVYYLIKSSSKLYGDDDGDVPIVGTTDNLSPLWVVVGRMWRFSQSIWNRRKSAGGGSCTHRNCMFRV